MRAVADPWRLVNSGGAIDASQLLAAVCQLALEPSRDVRSTLLIRDALRGLSSHWGEDELNRRLRAYGDKEAFEGFRHAHPQELGFTTLQGRLMDATDPDVLLQMLREVGRRISTPTSILVGGSLVLMMEGLIMRTTDDVDLVDELPTVLRTDPALLAELKTRYGLAVTHFQSHFLPRGWEGRISSVGQFDKLSVSKVDAMDILIGKLFSRRTKDLDDLRRAWPLVDQATFRQRLIRDTASFRSDPALNAAAEQNWYIVTGENTLPS